MSELNTLFLVREFKRMSDVRTIRGTRQREKLLRAIEMELSVRALRAYRNVVLGLGESCAR